MSDELSLVAQEPRPQPRCGNTTKDSVMDTVSCFAIGFVFVGLIFSATGFLYPRGIQHDPTKTAKENEEMEAEYMQLTDALNAIIIAGMVLTGLGGLILSAIFTNTVVCHECHKNDQNRTMTSQQQMKSRDSSSNIASTVSDGNVNYGTLSQGSSAAN